MLVGHAKYDQPGNLDAVCAAQQILTASTWQAPSPVEARPVLHLNPPLIVVNVFRENSRYAFSSDGAVPD